MRNILIRGSRMMDEPMRLAIDGLRVEVQSVKSWKEIGPPESEISDQTVDEWEISEIHNFTLPLELTEWLRGVEKGVFLMDHNAIWEDSEKRS